MRRLYVTLASLIVIATGAQAQQPVKLSLDDCIAYAMSNSVTMKNARLDVQIQQAQVKQTTALAMPTLGGKSDLVHFSPKHQQFSFFDASAFNPQAPKGTISPVPFTIPYTASASVTLSQVLFDGSLLVALQARNSIMDLARSTEQMTAENIRYGVHKAYNSLVISYKQFEIIKSSLALARTMEQDLIKTREAGFAEKIDVERTSVQINNLATDSLKVANMLTVAEQMLKYQLGMDINAQIILTDTSIEKNTAQLALLVTEKGSYDRVPEYTVLMNALKLNEYDLKRYKLAALPTLAGFTSRGVNFGASTFSGITQLDKYIEYYNGGLSLTVPLFNGFARQYQVREAKLKIEKTKNNIEYTKQSIDFQAANARTTLKNALLQIQSQKRNLDLSNSVLDLAQRKYKAGVGSNLEVTTAQTDLLRSQNNYFAALLEAINAEADLKKALGMLK